MSGGNEQCSEHKVVSVINATSRFCDRKTLDESTPEGSAIGFDMGIIIDAMTAINKLQR